MWEIEIGLTSNIRGVCVPSDGAGPATWKGKVGCKEQFLEGVIRVGRIRSEMSRCFGTWFDFWNHPPCTAPNKYATYIHTYIHVHTYCLVDKDTYMHTYMHIYMHQCIPHIYTP